MNDAPAFIYMHHNPKGSNTAHTAKQHLVLKILVGCIAITALALSSFPVQARSVYKWVDENGKTIYSQSPPPEGKAERITTPSVSKEKAAKAAEAAKKKLQEQLNKMDALKEQRDLAKQKKKEDSLSAKELEKTCNEVRNNISLLSNYGHRVSLKTEDGSNATLPHEERQKQLEKNQAFLKKHCTK